MEKKINPKTDIDLLLSYISHNNREGLNFLYERFSAILYGLALMSVSPEHAEEIVQLTLVKIWRSSEEYKLQETSFKTWVIIMLIKTMEEFLESRNILFSFKSDHYPKFTFDLKA